VNILLDSHFVLWFGDGEPERAPKEAQRLVSEPGHTISISAASFWELSIKARKHGFGSRRAIEEMPSVLAEGGFLHLPVTHRHATAELQVRPKTKDPFDRILLAQCQVEDMRLLTVDAELIDHPLALKLCDKKRP
jgi:PIN domain nuclease of toxin-antitoxin system